MDPVLDVEVWPARRAPFRAMTAAIWTVGIATLAYVWMGLAGGLFAFFLLVAWLADFWFPWRVRLSPEGVSLVRMGRTFFLPWDEVKRVVITESGVLFSRSRKPSFMERYRGIWIPFPPEELTAHLEEVYDGPVQRVS